MAFAPTTPVTGSAQAGFTAPTYTIAVDSNPSQFGKQYYVTALGGTQVGVTVHSASSPFTLSAFRPSTIKVLAPVNPVTGQLRNVPMNTYKVITRKGVLPLAGQAVKTAWISSNLEIPAGSDLADLPNLKAMISAHIGLLTQISSELGVTVGTGTI